MIAGIVGSNLTDSMVVHLVFVVRCVSSSLCDELITCSQESLPGVYVSNCVWCRNLKMRRPRNNLGCCTTEKNILPT